MPISLANMTNMGGSSLELQWKLEKNQIFFFNLAKISCDFFVKLDKDKNRVSSDCLGQYWSCLIRHDICQIFYTSRFSKSLKFTLSLFLSLRGARQAQIFLGSQGDFYQEKSESDLGTLYWFVGKVASKNLNMELYVVCVCVFLHIVELCVCSRTHKSLWFQLTETPVYCAHVVIFIIFVPTVPCAHIEPCVHDVSCVHAYGHSNNVCPSLNWAGCLALGSSGSGFLNTFKIGI